jgi:hypothetical protein
VVYRWQQQYVLATYCYRYAKFDYYNEEFMQYLMSDLHQRFIGSLNYNKPLAVGDIFRADNTKTYTVVSINDTRNKSKDVKSVTVIPVRETANSN